MATLNVTSAADSGTGSLREAIASANSGDTIVFDSSLAGKTITLTSGQIDLKVGSNLTIDGSGAAGVTISGNNASRIFYLNSTSVNPTSLTVKNITLANAYTSERGGAIATTHQGILTLENTNFLNNTADKGGGAIFSAYEGKLSVTGSKFDGNIATAANDERGAGAIAFWGPDAITVKDSEFTNNKGINGAAINSLNGKLTIENSKFLNNDTTAAFYDTGKQNPFLRGFGGAIYTDRASTSSDATSGTIKIINSVFEGNQGKGEGGAAYLYTGKQDSVIIEGSTFKDNNVAALPNGGNGGSGGAIVQMSNDVNKGFTVTNSNFINNTAAKNGGGIWAMNAPTTITNSTFSGNRGESLNYDGNGGALSLYNQKATITNSTFAENYAGWVGGAIAANTDLDVKNSIFYQNVAQNGNNGWGIQQNTSRVMNDLGGNIQFGADKNQATANILLADPKLGALQQVNNQWVRPLLAGSAAIDAGVVGAPNTDQTGNVRQDGNFDGIVTPDSGAFEAPGTPLPEIEVYDGSTSILDNTTTALNLGNVVVGTPITKAFTIKNSGTADLTLSNPQLPTGFSLVGNLANTIASGQQATLQIQVDAATAGDYSGEISFTTNDSDENPFNFAIAAKVTATPEPEIQIFDGTTEILDNTTMPLDFGIATVGGTLSKTLTIKNSGTADLNLTNPLNLPAGFSLVGNLPSAIAAGQQANITLNIDTATAGAYNGEFSLTNNDSDESTFNFAVAATVSATPVNQQPILNQAIADQTAIVGTPFSLDLKPYFSDPDNDPLTYSATNLPNGLSLDANTGILSGNITAAGLSQISITADDGKGSQISDQFDLTTNPATTPIGNPSNPSGGNPVTKDPGFKHLGNYIFQLQGDASQLQFNLKANTSKAVNEIGVFLVDNDSGSINNIAPQENGYLQAALDRSQVVFSTLANNQFSEMNFSRQLGFGADSRLSFFLVQNGSIDTAKSQLAAGKMPGNIFFATAGYLQNNAMGNNTFSFSWEDGMGNTMDFQDLQMEVALTKNPPPMGMGSNLELIDLRNHNGLLPANFTVNSDAAYDNSFGFYAVDNENGTINGLNPGDVGYAEAAVANRIDPATGMPGGKILAPFLIANGSAEQFLSQNPKNQAADSPMAYFAFLGANPDQKDHVRLLGDNTIGFEDWYGGGDQDFNDMVVKVNFA
ncbi:MAG: choice-of-anchor D domain-containing protein [Jaaginema sp. PMC 1079.18]|nr:choice-of-anchor D domain-containing protein [Jaaginema sp. PMC 1080.18]MEC4851596.1 choice-of-anchor D domain-containing protein [Jaaginema sp. PMC 1079.18]MEC4865061.1 choice-of-anchor D domain-containing protein [Jaaginema sp. PMC 1078.18]